MGSSFLNIERPRQPRTGQLRMITVIVAIGLLVVFTQAASITDDQDTCKVAAEQVGVNFKKFHYNVGHVLHALTVEDARFFFDENFPLENNIPTVNTNHTGPPVLPHAPSFPSKFKFPLGSKMDRILLNNDDPNAAFQRGFKSLEELGHSAHMMEMLYETSKVYKLLENIDTGKVCPCLVNEEENGILDVMRFIAQVNEFKFDSSKSYEEQGLRVDEHCTNQLPRSGRSANAKVKIAGGYITPTFNYDPPPTVGFKYNLRKKRSIDVCPNVPDITDSESWKQFQNDVAEVYEKVDGTTSIQMATNVAVYLYCKISLLSQ